MAEVASSVALDSATVIVGVNGAQLETSTASATSSSTSVAGVAAANAKATNATGIQDSSLTAGEDQSVDATATGSTSATSETVTAGPIVDSTVTAIDASGVVTSTSTDINVGDAVVFTSLTGGTGINTNQIYYVIASNSGVSYTISETPGGSAVTDSDDNYTAGSADLQTSSAAAFFSSDAGAITDTTATDVDITGGATVDIDAVATNTATATATNTEGDTAAQANFNESVGLQNIGVSAGTSGDLDVDVDADAIASATTAGDAAAPANATAMADADNIIGIQDVGDTSGDFEFGTSADISVNVGTSADRITVSATASSQTGDADADALLSENTGIHEYANSASEVAEIKVGTDANITANAFNDVDSSAITSTGDSTADAAINEAFGINIDYSSTNSATSASLVSGESSTVTATADTLSTVSATTETGAATADNDLLETAGIEINTLTAGTSATTDGTAVFELTTTASATTGAAIAETDMDGSAYGTDVRTLTTGTTANINGIANATVTSDAESIDGLANSHSHIYDPAGIVLETTTIGTSAQISGEASITSQSNSSSTNSASDADTYFDFATGVFSYGTTNVGDSASITGTVTVNQTANASTVGDTPAADYATAQVGRSTADMIGIWLDDADTTVGKDLTLTGTTTLTQNSVAQGVNSNTSSNIDNDYLSGIHTDERTVSAGGNIDFTGNVVGLSTSQASSATGDAESEILINKAGAAPQDDTTYWNSGNNVNINAETEIHSNSNATTGAGDASSTINILDTTNISLIDITSGADIEILAESNISQIGTAISTGINGGGNTSNTTIADAEDHDGILFSTILAGIDANSFKASVNLLGSASSQIIHGDATATAGDSTDIIGMSDSDVLIGRDATTGLELDAASTLTSVANSTWGDATATSDDIDTSGNEYTDITVGRDAGTISASSINTISSTALSSGRSTGADRASASIDQESNGNKNATISIGSDGNIMNVASISATSSATNVGDSANTDLSSSVIEAESEALEQNTVETIVIGSTGNVQSQAQFSGSSFAHNVNGSAAGTGSSSGVYSRGDLDVYGKELNQATSDITIGKNGNITGLGIVGSLGSDGLLANAVAVTSTTTEGTSYADADVNASGIEGDDDGANSSAGLQQTLLTAGPTDGDIIGQTITGMSATSNSIDDASDSDMNADIHGLLEVDMLGGQTGVNLIKGTTTGDFDSISTSVAGNATADGAVNGYSIYDNDGDGFITTSGNVQAISSLLNTATASSISGSASANPTTSSVGLGNYLVTIIGSGTTSSTAIGAADSTTSSVAGRAF